jgi:hypothetical protein
MNEIHFGKAVSLRKLEDLSANELRAKLILAGVNVPKDIKTKEELVELVKKYC